MVDFHNFLTTIGKALIFPIANSVAYTLSPKLYKTRMIFLVALSLASARALNSQIVRFFNNDHIIFLYWLVYQYSQLFNCFFLLNKIKNIMES
ncbi:MAG: hypothetical protein LBR15_06920 [Methanobrevibacter sp.]|nr:hypothetical protein [Candidatus Methanovirga australis]